MKISKISINNFRSIKKQEINVGGQNILIGENNSGKSNVIDAIRFFYDEIKVDSADFYNHEDGILSVEVEFNLTEESKKFFESKGEKYILDNDSIIVIKQATKSAGTINDLGRKGKLKETSDFDEDNRFFGFNGVSKALLADIIYVPPLKKIEDELKTTNQSTIMMKILKKIVGDKVADDQSFKAINDSLKEINDKKIFSNVEKDLSNMMQGYGCDVLFKFEQIEPSDIISRASLKLQESDGTPEMGVSSKGVGTQRALLINLIRYWAQSEIQAKNKIDTGRIAPTLVLIEEPEIFQHPQKQKLLFWELKKLSDDENTQLFINTHSSHFIVERDEDVLDIVRVSKENNQTILTQLQKDGDAFMESQKHKSFKFYKWLNGERSKLFFSTKLILCEGNTEKLLIEFLLADKYKTDYITRESFTVIDCGGKWNIPHWIRLCEELNINYYLVYDLDNNKDQDHIDINNLITNLKQDFFKSEYVSQGDIEKTLFASSGGTGNEKSNIVERIENAEADSAILDAIKEII